MPPRRFLCAAVAFSGLALLVAAPAVAQDDPIFDLFQGLIEGITEGPADPLTGDAEDSGDIVAEFQGGVSLPEDAELKRRIGQAARLAESGRAADAAQALGRIAESISESDTFLRTDGQTLRSGKVEVQRLIGESADEVRAAYENTFGPAARRMLDDAANDPGLARRVATDYPYTSAGADALFQFAQASTDAGADAEAVLILERLAAIAPRAAAAREPAFSLRLAACRSRIGDRAGAQEALGKARRHSAGSNPPALEGRSIGTDPSDALLTRLGPAPAASFTRHPGDSDATRAASDRPLLLPRWSVPIGQSNRIVAEGRRLLATAPVLFPTVAGSLVLRPDARGFVAHDLETGRVLWRHSARTISPAGPEATWTAIAAGRLSTDGRSLFLVEGDPRSGGSTASSPAIAPAFQQQQALLQFQGGFFGGNAEPPVSVSAPLANLLVALDVTPPRQGNLLWRVGGVDGGSEPRLAGHAFLGPPLAAHGQLYAVVEQDRNVRLAVLDSDSGRLEWSLELGQAEVPLSDDPQRQRIGATPTLSKGVLFCPTGGGSVVAVDLVGRSLLWGFRYARSSPPVVEDWDFEVGMTSDPLGWLDGTVRVAAGRVYLTPPESDEIYCVHPQTGDLLWQRPRGEALFFAAADADRAVLVGRSTLTLLDASDGIAVGSAVTFPSQAITTGRGYEADGKYVQPLSDGSLLGISLATGETGLVERSPQAFSAGNLVWHNRLLLSLGPDFLRAFDVRPDRQASGGSTGKEPHSDNAVESLREADLHLEAGRVADAITSYRRAHRLSGTTFTRNRLVAALLDGVRLQLPDAAAYDTELEILSSHGPPAGFSPTPARSDAQLGGH